VTQITDDTVIGKENEMLSADFKAVFPHTERRETVLCESCHADSRRLMRERKEDRLYLTDKDGLPFESFYNQKGFNVIGGRFVNDSEYKRIMSKNKEYKRASMKKWKQVTDTVESAGK
jgi:hypothetical protein